MSVIFNELGGGTSGIDYVSSTRPSSPSDGQLWFKPTDNGNAGTAGLWIYDETADKWLSANQLVIQGEETTFNGTATRAIQGNFPCTSFYVEEIYADIFVNAGTPSDASNEYRITVGMGRAGSVIETTILSTKGLWSDYGIQIVERKGIAQPVNTYFDNSSIVNGSNGFSRQVAYTMTKVGAVPNTIISLSILYRKVHP